MTEAEQHEQIAAALAERGYAVVADYLAPEDAAALRAEGECRRAGREFHPARVGRGGAAHRDVAIRGDEICWLDLPSASTREASLLARYERLRTALNRELFLGLVEIEGHYARYLPGASYARHLDRFRDDDARAVSLILYLNEGWSPVDGGELRLYAAPESSQPTVRVLPRAGTLVALRADVIEHEVALARRERWSVAAWLRRRPLASSH